MTATFAESGVVKDGAPWGSLVVTIDGKDRTKVFDVPTKVLGYQRLEPGAYGPATIEFPGLPVFGGFGTGEYSWIKRGAQVRIWQRKPDGTRGKLKWRGHIARPKRGTTTATFECDGHLTGRASAADKQSELICFVKDAGVLVADAIRRAGFRPVPALGPKTGVELAERTLDGGSLWDYITGVLSLAQDDDEQWTIVPTATGSGYRMKRKDRTTVTATVFAGAAGVDVDLAEDIAEAPNRFFGYGRDPKTNELWTNARYPGLMQGPAPAFPGNMTEGATGEDVDDLQAKLSQMGYLSRADSLESSEYDADTTRAVKRLQREAGLAVTGDVNLATWRALYDVERTGPSLRGATVVPLAADPRVIKYLRTANGSRIGINPEYDPTVVPVDRTIDFGVMSQRRATDWCQRQIDRLLNEGPGLVGTITLTADVWAGDVTFEDTVDGTAVPLSRMDLDEGVNLRVHNVDGRSLLVRAAVVDVTPGEPGTPTSVRLAVDERARDALELAAMVKRDRESRVRPYRAFKQSRKSEGRKGVPEATKDFGWLWSRVHLAAGEWTVFPVVAGVTGTVNETKLVMTVPREAVVAVTNDKTTPRFWNRLVGNPFVKDNWTSEKVRDKIDDQRMLLAAWGTDEKPVGRQHGDLTGRFLDRDPYGYHTKDGLLWVAVYVRGGGTALKPQRILRPVIETGV